MTTNSLAKLKAKKNEYKRKQEDFNRPKPKWFKINPGEKLNVQFLQELSEDSPRFNGSYGTSPADEDYNIGVFYTAVEHEAHGPNGFLSRALDTMETEGKDFAQEMYEKTGESGWRRKENFYITVAVDRGNGKPEVEILSRGVNNDFVDELVSMYEDDPDSPGITGRTFQIKKGSTKNSPWSIREMPNIELDVSSLVPYDLARDAVRRVSYENQREYYLKNYKPDSESDLADEAQTASTRPEDDEPDW